MNKKIYCAYCGKHTGTLSVMKRHLVRYHDLTLNGTKPILEHVDIK